MAYDIACFDVSFPAGEDLSDKLYRAVRLDPTNGAVVLTGVGQLGLGVLQSDAKPGDAVAVRILGVSKVKVAESIPAGARISGYTGGLVRAAVSGDFPLGIALEEATEAGQIVSALLVPCFREV